MDNYNIIIKNSDGFVQIDDILPSPRVIETGIIASGTSINFPRLPGGLYIRPENINNGVYLSAGRNIIYCQNSGNVEYIVLGDARTAKISGYGLYIRNGNQETTFVDSMKFGIIKFSGSLPANIANGPVTLNWNKEYPDAKPYISTLSLGLDRWQIGATYVTYHNIMAKFNKFANNDGITLSTFVSQILNPVWDSTFTYNIPNFLQVIQV